MRVNAIAVGSTRGLVQPASRIVLHMVREGHGYDLVLSDMSRPPSRYAGLELARRLAARKSPRPPLIFYVGPADIDLRIPEAHAITCRPDELMHHILDVLERNRV